jgi:hypothetical protein
MRHLTLMVLGLCVSAPGLAMAQEPDRDREKELEHAMQQVEQAQQQLENALDRIRASESEAANEALREAMAALRAAERQLRSGYYRDLYTDLARARVMVGPERVWTVPEADVSVLVGVGRPQMGVILETDRRRGETVGAVIRAVTPGGPADEAGIEAGDVIVEANGTELASSGRRDDTPSEKLVGVIQELEEGETLSVKYRRGDETHTAEMEVRHLEPLSYAYSFRSDPAENLMIVEPPNVDVRVREPRVALEFAAPVFGAMLPFGWLSMEMVTLDEELGEYFGTSEGLLVIRPPKDDSIDLRSGDVILGIDGRTPTSPSHALRIMRSYESGESMTLQVMRNKRNVEVTVTVPDRDRGFFWEGGWEHDDKEEHEDR